MRPLPTQQTIESQTTDSGDSERRGFLASIGAVAAALLASLCCIGPLVFVTLGVGASLASRFEPLRPVFTILTLGLLATGFYSVYGRRVALDPAQESGLSCAPDGTCSVPRKRTKDKALLWAATVVALLLLTFPQWSLLLV